MRTLFKIKFARNISCIARLIQIAEHLMGQTASVVLIGITSPYTLWYKVGIVEPTNPNGWLQQSLVIL